MWTGDILMTVPSWAFGAILSLVALAFTAAGFFFSRGKAIEQKARESGVISEKLDTIQKALTKIENGQAQQQTQCAFRGERLALVEASAKSAHKRLDDFIHEKPWIRGE